MNTDVLCSSNDNHTSFEVKTIWQIFTENARMNPDHAALHYQGRNITYKTLDELSNQLARLIQKQYKRITQTELQPGTLIPISIPRSAEYVIGILAILKCGAAYVPINPDYPDTRIRFILDDIKATVILALHDLDEKFSNLHGKIREIIVDEVNFINESKDTLYPQITPYSTAYVIYTSGSTGTPKGVMAAHMNVVAQVICADYFKADATDNMIFLSDVAFDSTTFEIWGALLNGARLIIPENVLDLLSDARRFKKTLHDYHITIVLLTTALFDLLYTLDETLFSSLKYLLVGGEALTKHLILKLLHSQYKPEYLINAYGPTENSTFCTTHLIKNDFSHVASVPIGKPYSNRVALVLDKYQNLMPVGIVGEMVVGGPSLSNGYLNNSALTQERFITNPYNSEMSFTSERIYKTNDLVRWLPEGILEYAGRNDFQVKLRGYRIELGEIEARFLEYPGVKHSVVLLKKNMNQSYLVAYYVADEKIDESKLRNVLANLLPDYMLPSVIMYLKHLPVTTNGKLDRKGLPEPNYNVDIQVDLFVDMTLQQKIRVLWSKLLNIANFSSDESFFNLGGNSLLAMKLRSEIEKVLKIKISMVELFQYPTLRTLADFITRQLHTNDKTTISPTNACSIGSPILDESIAVVGMSSRIPGADSGEAFWQMLVDGHTNCREYSIEELQNSNVSDLQLNDISYVKRGATFDDNFCFDASFFGYSVKDAELIDPQQRYFLECAWEALEFSGNIPEKFNGDIGVFASQGRNYYFMDAVYPKCSQQSDLNVFQSILGNEKDFLSTRTSYKLNLTGPSITLQTACSSSLVAIQMACESLKTKGCDMAIAGGVSIFYNKGYKYHDEMIESKDGFCRAFDAESNGTIVTSGVGVVVLKRLTDALSQNDTIYAVIKGGAINNDGASKMAFTAPSIKGQSAVIEKALKNAGVTADSISYIEAHGTGTRLGDPIEWKALHEVYERYRDNQDICTIGAVKTNIGHTDSAAGVLGLIKTVYALHYQLLPATLHFKSLNPEIANFNRLFKVETELISWQSQNGHRRAAVSSFGLGGTNAHVILEEYNQKTEVSHRRFHLVPFSAKTEQSLVAMAKKLQYQFSKSDVDQYDDFAFTAQRGRAEFDKRGYCLLDSLAGDLQNRIHFQPLHLQSASENTPWILEITSLKLTEMHQYHDFYIGNRHFQNNFNVVAEIISQVYSVDIISALSGECVSTPLVNDLLSFALLYALSRLVIDSSSQPIGIIAYALGAYVSGVLMNVMSLKEAVSYIVNGPLTIPCDLKVDTEYKIKSYSHAKHDWATSEELQKGSYWLKMSYQSIRGQSRLNLEPLVTVGGSYGVNVSDRDHSQLDLNEIWYPEMNYLNCLGWFWTHGFKLEWDIINPVTSDRKKVSLPTYCFEKQHYEIQTSERPVSFEDEVTPELDLQTLETQLKSIWSSVLGLKADEINSSSQFIDLGGDSLAFIDLFNAVKKSYIPDLRLEEILQYEVFDSMLQFIEERESICIP